MRDEEGTIIYIGKACVLRHRLASYFSGEKDIKTRTLLRRAASIETIIVDNEYSALLLENTLIKQHSPKYNINLKDGKSYPVVRVTADQFPKIFRTRRIVEDGSLYYGPFPNVPALDVLLELTAKLFPLRKCRRFRKRDAPCMYYHIGRCSAPCCGKISQAEYAVHVERAKALLAGDTAGLVKDLSAEMLVAAQARDYEKAARLRDDIRAIEALNEAGSVVDFDPDARDYIAWVMEGVLATFSVFSLRGGKMTGRELFRTLSAANDEDSLESFLTSYYGPDHPPPPHIYLGGTYSNTVLARVRRWLSERCAVSVEFLKPNEKRHEAVLAMALQNASEDLRKRLRERGAGPALDELRSVLRLKQRPERIEGFDIAQLDGKHTVASLISFKEGVPDKKNYRYYKIKSTEGQVDDFTAMKEAVARRYGRLLSEASELPDLVLIDGGIGQVNAAKAILGELGITIDIVGLAKRDEELWLPQATAPIRLSKRSEALKVLQHIRDETHRFATGLNQRLRSKDIALKSLQAVNGIGVKRAAVLLKTFGSIEALAAADPAAVVNQCSLSKQLALSVVAAAREALVFAAREKERLRIARVRRVPSVSPNTLPASYSAAPKELGGLAAEALMNYDKQAESSPGENQ